MKKYPTLYARSSTGAILEWLIEQDNNQYRTISGQQNGKKVTSEFTTCYGKNIGKSNETSDQEQCEAEIAAKYVKQIKADYKENIGDIDNNTFYQVMLAKKYKDYAGEMPFPAIIDRKYNGSRLVARKTGLFTRKGEIYCSIPHIYETLKPIFDKYPNIILDGEAYNHDYRYKLNEIMSIVRREVHITQNHLDESRAKIKMYCYDGHGFENITENTPLIERRSALKKILTGVKYIELVSGTIINSESEMMKLYQSYVDDGYEGAMYRKIDSKYETKRSKFLLKIKPEDSSEAIITDINEGTGNWAGTGKVITLNWKGVIFNATFKGTYEQAVEFLINKDKWIGREVTFLYNGLTGLGVPNFARMDIDNCIKS